MTRGELLSRMSSIELSSWWALFQIRAEEHQRAKDLADSGDGQVIVHGKDDEDDDDDE